MSNSQPRMTEPGPARGERRICLVAHFAYGAMTGGAAGHIGGVENQTSLTAKWLASRGHRVSMLTWDEGQEDEVVIDGVRVIKMCRRDEGIPGLRFLHPRWTSLNAALRRADAEVYYHNCGEYVTGQVAWWCRRNGRRFVYCVASDPDCDPRLPEMTKRRERVLYRYGLKHADRVIVQTRRQQSLLESGFGRKSIVIPMPCPGPDESESAAVARTNPKGSNVAWIGRIVPLKRLEWLLDVATALPEIGFEVVGPIEQENDYSRNLLTRAKSISNVLLRGPLPRAAMRDVYRNAACLCCTSRIEGFPNTFLEAWSWGVPVVSTHDPDGLIAEHGLGGVADDVPGLVLSLRKLLASPEVWRSASRKARAYYVENHAAERVLPRFEETFFECMNGSAARRAPLPHPVGQGA